MIAYARDTIAALVLVVALVWALDRLLAPVQTWWKRHKARRWRRAMRIMRNPVSDDRSSITAFRRHVSK